MAKGVRLGGRQKGTPNKDKSECQELAERLGVSPFEVLLYIAKGDPAALGYAQGVVIETGIRAKAAAEACKYLYPQRRSVEVEIPEPIQVQIVDYTKKGD